jgi:hypothetical protein
MKKEKYCENKKIKMHLFKQTEVNVIACWSKYTTCEFNLIQRIELKEV